jgi:hypothetical protein
MSSTSPKKNLANKKIQIHHVLKMLNEKHQSNLGKPPHSLGVLRT